MSNKCKVEKAIWNIKLTQEEKSIVNEIMLYKHLIDLELGNEICEVLRMKLAETLLGLVKNWCDLTSNQTITSNHSRL